MKKIKNPPKSPKIAILKNRQQNSLPAKGGLDLLVMKKYFQSGRN